MVLVCNNSTRNDSSSNNNTCNNGTTKYPLVPGVVFPLTFKIKVTRTFDLLLEYSNERKKRKLSHSIRTLVNQTQRESQCAICRHAEIC